MGFVIPEDHQARMALSSLGVGFIETDQAGQVVYMNHFAEVMTGWTQATARRRALDSVFRLAEDLGNGWGGLADRRDGRGRFGPERVEALIIRRDGQRFPIEYSLAPAPGGATKPGMVVVFTDASERRLMALHLARVSKQDLLTGLLNRSSFTENLSAAVESCRAKGEHHVVCFLDIDQFKLVNDTCGHHAGDDLLQWVAALLREAVGEHDTAARFGGDEFAILLKNRTLDEALLFAQDLQRRLREFSFTWAEMSFTVSTAIGIAALTDPESTPAGLLSAADHACYVAKDKGRGGIQVFEPDDAESSQRLDEMNLVAQIHHKLQDGSARLYAQRIRRLVTGPPLGSQFEVLLRFKGSDGRVHDPGKIIRATERYGLMPTVDRWVIRTTLNHLKGLGADGLRRIHVCFINLSGLSLQDDSVLDFIRSQLSDSGVPPHKIGFEITETTAVRDLEQAQWFIQEVGSIGCRLSLDDFGTGVASYAYLKSLPVEYLKIDGGFVESMLTSALDRAMVESINQISHVLGMQTVAESVASREVLNQVRDIGIDHAQGFWISHPQPINQACAAPN